MPRFRSRGRMRGRALAAATLCVALVAAASAQAPPAPRAPPDPPSPSAPAATSAGDAGVGAFSSRLIRVENDFIRRRYEDIVRARYADAPDGAQQVRRTLRTPTTADGRPMLARGQIASGEFAGDWQFGAPAEGWPTVAWQDIDRSDAAGYAAERIGHCLGSDDACAAWFDAGRHRAPMPAAEAGTLAQQQWRQRVMREPCTPVAAHRPSLAPLQSAVGQAGLPPTPLAVGVLLNPCGEVRAAWIMESSGHRQVDRAAVGWARRLVMPEAITGPGGIGMTGKLPMRVSGESFETPAETAPQED